MTDTQSTSLVYASPLRPRSTFDQRAFLIVFVADAIALPAAMWLGSAGWTSWLIASPLIVLNLPALPLSAVFAILFEDARGATPAIEVARTAGMLLAEVLFASAGWAFVVARLLRRRR